VKNTNSFLYKIEIHSMYLNSIWLNFNSTIGLRFSWIDSNSIKDNGMQISGKCIQYCLVNMLLKKHLIQNLKKHISMPLHLRMS